MGGNGGGHGSAGLPGSAGIRRRGDGGTGVAKRLETSHMAGGAALTLNGWAIPEAKNPTNAKCEQEPGVSG
jgi:hypothetical protein